MFVSMEEPQELSSTAYSPRLRYHVSCHLLEETFDLKACQLHCQQLHRLCHGIEYFSAIGSLYMTICILAIAEASATLVCVHQGHKFLGALLAGIREIRFVSDPASTAFA